MSVQKDTFSGGTEVTSGRRDVGEPSRVRDAKMRSDLRGGVTSAARPPASGWTHRYLILLILIDLVVAAVAMVVGHAVLDSTAPWPVVVAAVVTWPIAIALFGGYAPANIGVGSEELGAVARSAAYLVVAAAFIESIWSVPGVVKLGVTAALMMLGAGLVVRYLARKIVHRRQRQGRWLRQVLAVGSVSTVRHLTVIVEREPYCGLEVVGVCVPSAELNAARKAGLPVVGDTESVAEAVARTGCEGVAVTVSQSPEFLRRLSWSLESSNVSLFVHPGVAEVSGPRLRLRPHVGLPLVHVDQPLFTGWRKVVKRGTDIALTSIGLLLAGPLMLGIAIAIKLSDRGPVLFRQTRVGLDGHHFTMLKFRSMVVDAEKRLAELAERSDGDGLLFKMVDDPRITRVGRFLRRYSLDELPQLLNVLTGSMSLVGPRPPLPAEVAEYPDDVHRRLLVTPGLTGLWQVSGRSLLTWEESVRLDLRYVENWCLSLDMLLLWKTVGAVFARRGAF